MSVDVVCLAGAEAAGAAAGAAGAPTARAAHRHRNDPPLSSAAGERGSTSARVGGSNLLYVTLLGTKKVVCTTKTQH